MPPLPIIFFHTRRFPENRRFPLQRLSFRSCGTKKFGRIVMSPLLCMKTFDERVSLKHHSVLQWKNLVQSDQKFSKENCDNPYHEESFSIPQIFWNIEGMPTKFFGTVRPKNLDGKTWYPLFSSTKHFKTRNLLKNSRTPSRNFYALWDIKISTENRDMPALIHKFISIPETFWKTKGFLYKNCRFGPVGQKNRQNRFARPSYAWQFSKKWKFSETPKCSSMKSLGNVRQKLFDGKLW